MTNSLAAFRLPQITDSAFPVGGFAYSHRLERLATDRILSEPELAALLATYIDQVCGGQSLPAALAAHRARSHYALLAAVHGGTTPGQYAVAFGALAGETAAGEAETLRALGFSMVTSITQAAVRLGLAGQSAAGRLVAGAGAQLEATISRALAERPRRLLGAFSPTLDVAAVLHPTLVRAVPATPLRGPSPSATFTRLRVSRDATLIYLPGALVPHRDSDSRSVLHIAAADGARLIAASIVAPGRLAMSEASAFRHLQLRTSVRYAGRLVLAQHQSLRPASPSAPNPFDGAAACLSIICLGPWPPACPDWWSLLANAPGVTGGATRLRTDGVAYFATAQSLGDAQRLVGEVTSRLPKSAPTCSPRP